MMRHDGSGFGRARVVLGHLPGVCVPRYHTDVGQVGLSDNTNLMHAWDTVVATFCSHLLCSRRERSVWVDLPCDIMSASAVTSERVPSQSLQGIEPLSSVGYLVSLLPDTARISCGGPNTLQPPTEPS